jgi:hypothetical protein
MIEPPDILIIRATNIVPKPPYRVQPLDALYIQASETLPDSSIRGAYGIEPDGNVNLGLAYGTGNCLAGKADVHYGFLRENRRGTLNTAIEIATDMPMSPYNIRKTPCFRWCTNALRR